MPDAFGERLKTFRKKAGISQQELADNINLSLKTIQRWEKDERQPRLEEIKALAKALNVTEQDLLNDSAPDSGGWVLQIKVAHEFKEEVIDLSKDVPVECSITATPKGAYFTLGGNWSLWTEDNKKALIKQINKFFATVQQNGISFGALPKV